MFGNRCKGYLSCGHPVNWSCPCTCDEIDLEDAGSTPTPSSKPANSLPSNQIHPFATITTSEIAVKSHTKSVDIEALSRYLSHDDGCPANDMDPLDHSSCTCGLRKLYNPWGRAS
jgi:hypothetical protein